MLVSLDKIRKSLNIAISDTSKDNILKYYESIAKSWIENYCDQPIESKNIEFAFTSQTEIIYLNYFPVTALNNIRKRISVFDALEVLNVADFYLGKNGSHYIISKTSYANYEYIANISVGYTVIPEVIQNIALELINVLYNQYENQLVATTTSTQGFNSSQSNTTTIIDLTAKHKALLSKYKRISI